MNASEQLLKEAIECHKAGRLEQADRLYRKYLVHDPGCHEVYNLRGTAALAGGRLADADAFFARAIALAPREAQYHVNQGVLRMRQGRMDEALACFERASEIDPTNADAYAEASMVHLACGRSSEAEAAARRAVQINPDHVAGLKALAATLKRMCRRDEAIQLCQRVVQLQPDSHEMHTNLGILLAEAGLIDQGIQSLRRALTLRRDYPEAIVALGRILADHGQSDQAVELFQSHLQRHPDSVPVIMNLGNVLVGHGRVEQAITILRSVLSNPSGKPSLHSNYLMALNYVPGRTPEEISAAHKEWARHHEVPLLSRFIPHSNLPDPDRPLRVGYHGVFNSPDPVAPFIAQAIACHDRSRFQVVLYNQAREDRPIRDVFAQGAEVVHDVSVLSDDAFAELVRSDQIDILVDLFGHTDQGRLLVFARRPAPVQITYLGYCNTTGMRSMDWLITDEVVDPVEFESRYTEKLLRLQGCFCCYMPLGATPPPGELPAIRKGRITFASFHNLAKINRGVVKLWARVLREIPASRMLIARHTLTGSAVQRLTEWFGEEGVSSDRLELRSDVSPMAHWSLYHDADISLDVQPWSGHLTTCDSLWMGVPVITMLGRTHAGRMAATVLKHLGRDEWVACDEDCYVAAARRLAGDLGALANLRSHLRDEFAASDVCAGKRFAQRLEQAYRTAWQSWCRRAD